MMNQISAPSTRTKIAVVKIAIHLYESLMRDAFGECGVSGEKPPLPAYATAANASAAPRASTRTKVLRLTGTLRVQWTPKKLSCRRAVYPAAAARFPSQRGGILRRVAGSRVHHVG